MGNTSWIKEFQYVNAPFQDIDSKSNIDDNDCTALFEQWTFCVSL